MLRAEDFNNDKKDAGEIGAGQSVTALYELIPPGGKIPQSTTDPLKYQKVGTPAVGGGPETATVKVRYKEPTGEVSQLLTFPVGTASGSFDKASTNMRFASAVAAFGMLLRDSQFKGTSSFAEVLSWAETARGKDAEGYRAEFLKLVQGASAVAKRN
jgi:Ca-activated chloride channel family protein